MWQAIRENPRAVTYAVLMHVGLLLLLIIGLDWTPKAIQPGTHQPIQAELVDSTKLQAIEARKQAEQQRLAEEQRQRELEQQRKAEAEAKQKAEAERRRKAEAEAKQKAEAERKRKAEAEAKQKAEAERKRKAEAEAKQKAEAERKRKAEAEAKQKAEAERKRKAEQAAKEKAAAEEAARQREAEQALQAQLAEEQAQARAESALAGYIPQIQQKIQRNWLRPGGSAGGLSCLIRVKLIPGGEVVDARVVRSSGDPLFDRSVETAVLKASPLPLPPDAAMFTYFREIDFNFNPDS
jgi:colicin import membrane protein